MQTYIAILRGINVSGKNKIVMKELKAALEADNFQNVATYIQSGNVVFTHSPTDEKILANNIVSLIKSTFGLDVPVLVRTVDYIEQANANNPFLKREEIEFDKLHITFLGEAPQQENIDKLNSYSYPPDEVIVAGTAVYIYCPNGQARTKFHNSFIENKLKVTATGRNLKTVNKLIEMGKEAST